MGLGARVLLTDAEERAALAVSRGLRDRGYRVGGVAGLRPAAVHWSLSCDSRHTAPHPAADPAGFLSALVGLVGAGEYDILIPSSDVAVWVISRNRERLEAHVEVALPRRDVVDSALDKVQLGEVAAGVGLASPPGIVCVGVDQALGAASEIGFPVVLKAPRSFIAAENELRPRAVELVVDESSLVDAVRTTQASLLVQRFVTRPSVISCAGVMGLDSLLAVAVTRWVRRWPPETGAAAFCETITPPPGLVERVEELLGRLGYWGIFELELLDDGSGRLAAIDLNPRPFGWLAVAVDAGANLPAIFCDWLRGTPPPGMVVAAPGRRYRWEDGDLRHVVWQLRRGRLAEAAATMRPHRRVTHPFFRLADPAPLAARAVLLAGRLLGPQLVGAPAPLRAETSVREARPGLQERGRGPAENAPGHGGARIPGAGDEAHHGAEGEGSRRADEVEAWN